MSGYQGHLVGGVVSYAALLLLLKNTQPTVMSLFVWFLCSLAGSLFPDIDIKSKGQKYFYWILLGLILLCIFINRLDLVAIISVMSIVPLLVKHRGITHRLWFIVLLPLSIWLAVSASYPDVTDMLIVNVLFFIGGAISHLWLDFGFFRMLRTIIPRHYY
jgi:hypothetical protein